MPSASNDRTREKLATAAAWFAKLLDHVISAALLVAMGALAWFGEDLVSELRRESRAGDVKLSEKLERMEDRMVDRMHRHMVEESSRYQQHMETQRAVNREQSQLLREVAEAVARLDERTRD